MDPNEWIQTPGHRHQRAVGARGGDITHRTPPVHGRGQRSLEKKRRDRGQAERGEGSKQRTLGLSMVGGGDLLEKRGETVDTAAGGAVGGYGWR